MRHSAASARRASEVEVEVEVEDEVGGVGCALKVMRRAEW